MSRHNLLMASLFLTTCLLLFTKTSGSASVEKISRGARDWGPPANNVVLQAAGRGNPYLNFEDGVEMPTIYEGDAEMQSLLSSGGTEPRAIASADFDEDGVPDLICGYARAAGGIITLHRGNIDSIYQNSADAQQRKADGTFTGSAFLSPVRVFDAPTAADFVGAGDFDADGHWDLVIGSRRGKELFLLPGDGKGGFLNAQKIALAGAVTSLITGEINRADGLTDVIVGVVTASGAKALVFEGPEGALKTKPEIISLPGEPDALALGQFDGEYPTDLVVGAGSELVIIHGRDRKLSLDEKAQSEIPLAKLDRQTLGFEIRSIAVGDLEGSNQVSLALLAPEGRVYLMKMAAHQTSGKKKSFVARDIKLIGHQPGATQLVCARVSAGPANDLILLNEDRREFHILKTGLSNSTALSLTMSGRLGTSFEIGDEPIAVLPIRLNRDALSDLVVLRAGHIAPVVVKTATGSVFFVNTVDDHDDGTCDEGDCSLREAINAANGNPGMDTIAFNIPGAGPHAIQSFFQLPAASEAVVIDGTTQPGFSGKPIIELSLVGLTISGGDSTVRGIVVRDASVGIHLTTSGNNVIEGNFLGTDATGFDDRGNSGAGLVISGNGNNIIGGTTANARNLISGNGFYVYASAVVMVGEGAVHNLVRGNFIGTNFSGTAGIENTGYGVVIADGASQNCIGGTTPGAGNIISATSQIAMIIGGGASNNLVQGNFMGTDVYGTLAIPNYLAVGVLSSANTIGGTSPAARNVISGNFGDAVLISAFPGDRLASDNLVQGNWIGINIDGLSTPNRGSGVTISASNNLIGGVASGSGNIIAYNSLYGVRVDPAWDSARGNRILHNSISFNVRIGINLGIDDVTVNDPCDGDTGANNLQNSPSLTAATSNGITTTLQGALNSDPNTTFTLEFFSNVNCYYSSFSGGQTFIGSSTVTTGTDCSASFTITVPFAVPAGQAITATATSPAGNTSEFSQCVPVGQGAIYDLCLQDDSNSNILLVNSTTGAYQFTSCRGTALNGMGSLIKKGCLVTLQVNGSDRRVLARIDTCLRSGTATVQVLSDHTTFTIVDRNTANNTCACAGIS